MTRRLWLAPLFVAMLAFAGPAAAPVRSGQSLRVFPICLSAPEHGEHETRALAPRVAPAVAVSVSQPTQSAGFRWSPLDAYLFQRPPPTTL